MPRHTDTLVKFALMHKVPTEEHELFTNLVLLKEITKIGSWLARTNDPEIRDYAEKTVEEDRQKLNELLKGASEATVNALELYFDLQKED